MPVYYLIHPLVNSLIYENSCENSMIPSRSLFSFPPLFRKLQVCNICLDKLCVSKVTVLFLVFFHKVLHKVHGCHMMCLANQMSCVSSGKIKDHIFIKAYNQQNSPWSSLIIIIVTNSLRLLMLLFISF